MRNRALENICVVIFILDGPSPKQDDTQSLASALGVSDALSYEDALHDQGFGPDILHQVEDKELRSIGFRCGDIIRLKQNAQRWWNGLDAKQKRMVTVETMESMSATLMSLQALKPKIAHSLVLLSCYGNHFSHALLSIPSCYAS
ncbi:uncharacterized protein ARMOST_06275 [Armillaria ostoyae]|uniref:SAM domain-containing protein n=1 Tax=Armillaria ostoyae TaxID=47428 RepID=A0A284R2I3_ARMOS|nr:uncharacterized protein ARMOST_06275 [Armillaria ostoyae]